MAVVAARAWVAAHDAPTVAPASLGDVRFRALLGAEAWAALPAAVRGRFAKRLGPGVAVTYVGEVVACRMAVAGWLLAQLARAIGAPLPLGCDTGVPAVVSVTEDGESGGQVWTRLYGRRRGFPQVIHSAKRFAGPTGLEEYLGGGFGIALSVSGDASGIRFTSDHYFLALGRWRLRLPAWLAPGRLTIDHQDRGDGGFAFTLALEHRWFGDLIHQTCLFRDAPQRPKGSNDD